MSADDLDHVMASTQHAIVLAAWSTGIGCLLVMLNRYGIGWTLLRAGIRRDRELARSAMQAARIRRRWPKVSQNLGLALVDRTPVTSHTTSFGNRPAGPAPKPKIHVPRMRVHADQYGVICDVRTVAGVGLKEWQTSAQHVADDWRAVRVAVTQIKPGRIRVRAVRVDPLAAPTTYDPDPATLTAPKSLSSIEVGLDEFAEAVRLRLAGVSGICVCGLPGYGKSSFINNLITRLAPDPRVIFVGLDGKTDTPREGDFGEVADRFAILGGDDLEQANKILTELVDFGRARSRSIRTVLGRKNVWHGGEPSADWPLIIVIIDEAHTFFEVIKDGGNADLKRRNALATKNAMLVQELIKKRRAVGMLVLLATQKGTGDAIPTYIRDVCSVSLAFACRTIEAAIAGLGEGIRHYPDANPVDLQDPQYIGVAVMAVEGRSGYTRVRMPYVPDATAAAVATQHRGLVTSRGQLPLPPPAPALTGIAFDDDDLKD